MGGRDGNVKCAGVRLRLVSPAGLAVGGAGGVARGDPEDLHAHAALVTRHLEDLAGGQIVGVREQNLLEAQAADRLLVFV